MFSNKQLRRLALVSVLAPAVLLTACDSMLEVENAEAINEELVNDSTMLKQMVNGVTAAFQNNFAFLAYASAILGDEALNGHNFEQWRQIDLREVTEDNSRLDAIYEPVQEARGIGDEMISRMRPFVNDTMSMELATALTYTAYAYTQLGENFCWAPVERQGVSLPSNAILAKAVERFEEAIAIASRNTGAEPTRILNLARVGAARASLQQGRKPEAIAFASQVPASFEVWIKYLETPVAVQNYFGGVTSGTNASIGLDPSYVGLKDRRIRHAATSRTGHNQQTQLFLPYVSSSHSGWTATGADIPFTYDTDMRLASGLEARYIVAEAGGMDAGTLRAFIDERRAVGGQTPFTGTDLQAELREQRRRDFFLDGHRLPDLRRYRKQYGIDMFPKGAHPNDAKWGWGPYETATCFIPHQDERFGNPNYEPLNID